MKPYLWSAFLASVAPKCNDSSIAPEGDSSLRSVQKNTTDEDQILSQDDDKFWTPAKRVRVLAWLLGSSVVFPLLAPMVQSYTLSVRVDRWLEVRSIEGVVNFYRNNQVQAASTYSTRLEQVGDRITTGGDSSAILTVDTNIGSVMISENTDLSVQELSVTSTGGRVTRLNIATGQARLQVRPFLNPESELEIRTPAGVSGVRGTKFGVGVIPSGQTGISTTQGQVDAFAQGVTVSIDPGFQSLIVPGQPPTPPAPITDNVNIDITRLHSSGNSVRIAGWIDPFSLLTINEEIQDVNSEGWFNILVVRPDNDRIPVTVSTLSGKSKDYELAVP